MAGSSGRTKRKTIYERARISPASLSNPPYHNSVLRNRDLKKIIEGRAGGTHFLCHTLSPPQIFKTLSTFCHQILPPRDTLQRQGLYLRQFFLGLYSLQPCLSSLTAINLFKVVLVRLLTYFLNFTIILRQWNDWLWSENNASCGQQCQIFTYFWNILL